MQWRMFVLALLFLVTSSYLDNVRGPLLPLLNQALLIPYSQSVWLFVAASLGAVSTAGLYLKLTESKGLQFAKNFALAMGLISNVVTLWVHNELSLFIFAFLVGGAISSLGTLSNLLILHGTPTRYRASCYCALHTMYGAASALGPWVVPWVIHLGLKWQAVFAPSALLIVTLLCIPVRQTQTFTDGITAPIAPQPRLAGLAITTFVTYVLGEVLTSMWMVSFLVEARGYSVATASPYLTLFFICLAASRIVCILPTTNAQEKTILWASQLLFIVCLAVGWRVHPIGLSLSGLVGPFFPLFMARTTRHFGRRSQGVILRIFLAIPLCSAITNYAFGQATRWFSLDSLFLVCLAFALLTLPLLAAFFKAQQKTAEQPCQDALQPTL